MSFIFNQKAQFFFPIIASLTNIPHKGFHFFCAFAETSLKTICSLIDDHVVSLFLDAHTAARRESILFLQKAKLLESENANGHTPVHEAIIQSDNQTLIALLKAGASPNKTSQNFYPLTLTIQNDFTEGVKTLILFGADIHLVETGNRSFLHIATQSTGGKLVNLSIVESLLNAGINPNRLDSFGYSSLHYMVIQQDRTVAEMLLRNGANPNCLDKKNKTPLYHALIHGYLDIAALLIKKGAIIDGYITPMGSSIERKLNPTINKLDLKGKTSLYRALEQLPITATKDLKALFAQIKNLLEQGANPNLGSDDCSCLELTVNYPLVAHLLLDYNYQISDDCRSELCALFGPKGAPLSLLARLRGITTAQIENWQEAYRVARGFGL